MGKKPPKNWHKKLPKYLRVISEVVDSPGNAPMVLAMCPTERLKEWAANPRNNAEAAKRLEKVMDHHGYRVPAILDQKGIICGGHTRKISAISLEIPEVAVLVQWFATEEERVAFALAENQTSTYATFEFTGLADILQNLDTGEYDMEALTGFNAVELEDIATWTPAPQKGQTDPNQVPEPPAIPVTNFGDMWVLGDHVILCGDSRDTNDVKRAVGGHRIDLTLTDPPYSVGYSISFNKREGGRDPGTQTEYKESKDPFGLLRDFLSSEPSGFVIMTYPVDQNFRSLLRALEHAGFTEMRELIWVKGSPTFHPGATYQQQHEPILILRRKGIPYPRTVPSDAKTIITVDRPRSHTDHPTEKPGELWETLHRWHLAKGQRVYEPFSGSGRTIMTCEINGTICHAIEISPAFVDVAITRWQRYSGNKATLHGDGRTFDEIEQERTG